MSGEFRAVGSGSYFHRLLEEAGEDVTSEGVPRHRISKALTKIYAALAPIEKACAWYEAYDSGPADPMLELQASWDRLERVVWALREIKTEDASLIRDVFEQHGEQQ